MKPDTNHILYKDLEKILISSEQILERTRELGAEITRYYADKDLVCLGILKGSCIFMADLVRYIDCHLKMDFIGISSYGASTKSSGVVRITKDLEEDIEGKHVLIVEDIVDTGLTLNYLLKILRQRNPASMALCTLLNKPARRLLEVSIAYEGFAIEDFFVVGYGLDYIQNYRNLPCIGILKPEIYQKYQVRN